MHKEVFMIVFGLYWLISIGINLGYHYPLISRNFVYLLLAIIIAPFEVPMVIGNTMLGVTLIAKMLGNAKPVNINDLKDIVDNIKK